MPQKLIQWILMDHVYGIIFCPKTMYIEDQLLLLPTWMNLQRKYKSKNGEEEISGAPKWAKI